MEVLRWVAHNWFDAVQTLGIIAGLLFATLTLRSDLKSRRIENLLEITEHHRDIWKQLHQSPNLVRVLDPRAKLHRAPVTVPRSCSSTASFFISLARIKQ